MKVPAQAQTPRSEHIGPYRLTTGAFFFFLAAGLFVVSVLLFFDPEKSSFFPKCPLYAFTGFKCPVCGAQRALHAALHGDWILALTTCPSLFVLPFLLYHLLFSRSISPAKLRIAIVLLSLYTIFRNL